jgi:exopolysaccharide production protein ExoQ
MPAMVALVFCALFVFYLLRCDYRQSRTVSSALWVPTVWIFSIATKPLADWFGTGGDVDSGSSIDRIFTTCLLCLGLVILANRKLNWRLAIKQNGWLVLLLSYMLISILWSDIPFISFKRWVREITAVVMAFVVVSEPTPRQAMESLLRRTVYELIPFSALLIKYFPRYGVGYRWSGDLMWVGVTLQKNGLGRLCLISGFFLVWALVTRWKARRNYFSRSQALIELALLALVIWLLKGPASWAASASGFVALFAGLVVFAVLQWLKKHRLYVNGNAWTAIVIVIIIVGTVTPFVHGSFVASFASIVGRNETLTGRTDIWAGLVPLAKQHLFLGAGFGGFWDSDTEAAAMVNEAHNGYLEIVLQLGLVGVMVTGMFLLSFCESAVKALARDYDWACLCICYLLMAGIHNIDESSFDSFTRHQMAGILFLAVTLPAATKRRGQIKPAQSFMRGIGQKSPSELSAQGMGSWCRIGLKKPNHNETDLQGGLIRPNEINGGMKF